MSLKLQGIHFEKPKNSSWINKEVLRGSFGNFEVLNGPVLYIFLGLALKELWSVGTLGPDGHIG